MFTFDGCDKKTQDLKWSKKDIEALKALLESGGNYISASKKYKVSVRAITRVASRNGFHKKEHLRSDGYQRMQNALTRKARHHVFEPRKESEPLFPHKVELPNDISFIVLLKKGQDLSKIIEVYKNRKSVTNMQYTGK